MVAHDSWKGRAREALGRWLTEHRGAVVASTALPASFAMELWRRGRDAWHRHLGAAPERHEERVRHVQEQVRRWNASGSTRKMVTARPGWKTVSTRNAPYKAHFNRIDLDLKDVLGLDEERRVVRVEPLVNMGQLARYLVPRGWALEVMVEMEDLTAGGLSMGLGMETTSHRFGLLQETIEAFELVLSDGSLLRVTRESDPELFHALPWSHGTLGFLTAVELRVMPIKPFVRMRYIPCHSLEELCERTRALAVAEDAPEFLEATVFSRSTGVIQCGWLDDAPADRARIHPINRWYEPYFYMHVKSALTRGELEEWVPIRQYFHRHTRGLFWKLRELIPFAEHPAYRLLLGWMGAPKVSLLKRTMTEGVRKRLVYQQVAQDLLIPIREMKRAIELQDGLCGIYPLLVYPIRVYDHGDLQGLLRRPPHPEPGKSWEMYFDLGIYGIPAALRRGEPWDAPTAIRALEGFAREVGGCTLPWADLFMTRQEFEEMFDHRLYRRMRAKYDAERAFPEVWEKVRPQYALREEPASEDAGGHLQETNARSA
ncbi:MAG: FAD-binding oxidoreductase [Myxococcota bacterium]